MTSCLDAEAGKQVSKTFKLSVTVPEHIGIALPQNDSLQLSKTFDQDLHIEETVRDSEPIVLKTFTSR